MPEEEKQEFLFFRQSSSVYAMPGKLNVATYREQDIPPEQVCTTEKQMQASDLNGMIPLYFSGYYSETGIYTGVLLFKFSDNTSTLNTAIADYDLRGELESAISLRNKKAPYLAVLVPDGEERDCTPFLADLNVRAIDAINNPGST